MTPSRAKTMVTPANINFIVTTDFWFKQLKENYVFYDFQSDVATVLVDINITEVFP